MPTLFRILEYCSYTFDHICPISGSITCVPSTPNQIDSKIVNDFPSLLNIDRKKLLNLYLAQDGITILHYTHIPFQNTIRKFRSIFRNFPWFSLDIIRTKTNNSAFASRSVGFFESLKVFIGLPV